MIQELTDQERKDWLRLCRSENVGAITFRNLIDYYHTAQEAILHLPDFAKKGGKKRSIVLCSEKDAQREMDSVRRLGGRMLASCEPDYPEYLRQISDAPPIITVLGCESLMKKKCIAVVGTRNASLNGKNMARRLSFDLSQSDYVVVSGMARGMDSAAHEGALENTNGYGGTIAVLGTGIDVVYPEENKNLYQKINQNGLLLSEFPFSARPHVNHFPMRNRLISGLSLGVVVIEAQAHSGSLITAQCALDQNREVFAVPGNPLDPRSAGPNFLLKQGAHLTENIGDIQDVFETQQSFEMWRDFKQQTQDDAFVINPTFEDLPSARTLVLENLGSESVSVDELIRETHLSASVVNIVLVELELAGRLERSFGNLVTLLDNSLIG